MYKEPQALTDVSKFMKAFTQPVLDVPTIPSGERAALRVELIQEELNELVEAIANKDIVQCADAFADLQYVLSGAIHEFGLGRKFGVIFNNVHHSNMSKICRSYEEAAETLKHYKNQGTEVYSEKLEGDTYIIKRKSDHKVLKNLYYTPASLESIVKSEHDNADHLPPFVQRLIHEADSVGQDIKLLTIYIDKGMPNANPFNRIMLPLQLQAMKQYQDIVKIRIKDALGE